MANPLKVLTDLHISGSSGTATVVNGAISGSSTLQVAGVATLAGQVTASNGVRVTSGDLVVDGALSGSGTATFGGVTVNGNLTVAGSTTTINSTNLLVADKKIVIASGSTAATSFIDGAGVYFGNEDSSFARLSFSSASDGSSHKLSTNLYLDVASDKGYAINGSPFIQAKQDNINLGYTANGFGDLYARTASLMWNYGDTGPGGGTEFRSTAGILMGEFSGSQAGVLKGTYIQGSSSWMAATQNGIFFYDSTVGNIKSLSDLIPSQQTNVSTTQYTGFRSSVKGVKQSGGNTTVEFLLSGSNRDNNSGRQATGSAVTGLSASSGNPSNLITALGYASIDVAVKAVGTTSWTNDLVSVTVTASAAANGFHWPLIIVDLPGAADNSEVRLIVVNEDQKTLFG